MLMTSLFLYVYYFHEGVSLNREIGYAYHQLTGFCCGRTEAITAPISEFVFVLHLFKGTERICEMTESF